MINRMRELAHSGGPTLALITKADLARLVDAVDQCVAGKGSDLLTAALMRNTELRDRLSKVLRDCDQLADLSRKQTWEARSHGDERRRYMANNKALLARIEQLEATVGEMGEVIDDIGAEAEEWRQAYRTNLGRVMHLESAIAMIRRAAQ